MKKINWFFRQSLVTYRSVFGALDLKTFILTKFLSPIFSMLFFCYLARYAYGSDNMAEWVIGNAFAVCVFPVFLGAGLILMIERHIGTLRSIIASPTSSLVIFLSRSVMHIINAFMVCAVGLTVGILIFHLEFTDFRFDIFALILLVSMFAAIAMGMAFSSLGLIVRDINLFMNIFILGLIILSGANVRLDDFPAPLLFLSRLLPVTRGIEAARLLYSQGASDQVYLLIGQEALIGCIYFCLAYFLFRLIEHLARRHATIDLY